MWILKICCTHIEILNSKTNISSYPIQSTLNFITASGNFLCIGKIVVYHFTIKANQDWSDKTTPIFGGVPAPIVNNTCLSGMSYNEDTNTEVSFRMFGETIYLNNKLLANIPYTITGAYIAK